jgi:hypothetical protein
MTTDDNREKVLTDPATGRISTTLNQRVLLSISRLYYSNFTQHHKNFIVWRDIYVHPWRIYQKYKLAIFNSVSAYSQIVHIGQHIFITWKLLEITKTFRVVTDL